MSKATMLGNTFIWVILGFWPNFLLQCLADDPPRIENAPHDLVVLNSGVASFVCTAVGNPKPQLEWRKNGKRVTTQRYTVQDMPNGSVLRIEPVRAGRDNATYECVAENGVGEPVRALARLTVLLEGEAPDGYPRFSLQPSIQGVEKGRSALLPCKAEGDPSPNIHWLKDMIPVDMTNHRYSLVQGSSLQILEAEEEDQGTYECVAENRKGSVVSPMANLYVRVRRVPPYFSIPPEPLYEVTPGSNMNITCVAVGSPMPYVKWKKGSVELLNEEKAPIGKNILTLENVRESANYTCVASSKLGSIDATAQILVQAFPRAPSGVQISDVTSTSCRLSWSYDVGAENIIYYVIQYKPKHGNHEYKEISGITTMFYTVRDLTPYTEYEFFIIAANAIGRGIPSAPAIATTGDTDEVPGANKPGSAPRNLQARPLSSNTIVIQWDPPKEPNGQVTGYKVYYTRQPTLPTHSWQAQQVDNGKLTTISGLSSHTIYTIRVQAFTARGPGPLSAPIQVKTQEGVPSQPVDLRAFAKSSTTVQVSWHKPAHTGEEILGYDLYWNDTFTQQEYHRSIPDVETYTLGELYPDTLYFIWVSAKSRDGDGAATPPYPVRTEPYVPGEPLNVKVIALNSTTINVGWKPPANRDRNGLIRGYQIYVQEMNKDGDLVNEPLRFDVADEDAEEHNVTGLQPDTEYQVQVVAVTRKAEGSRSWSRNVRTAGGVPTRPEISVQISQDEPNLVVQVRWSRPTHVYGSLLSYRIRYGRVDGGHSETLEVNPPDDHITLEDLDRGARYEIRLAGKNGIGWGQEAVTFLDTPEGIPTAPPQNVSHRLQSPNTVAVSWDPPLPQYRNGHVTHFGYQFHKSSDSFPQERNTSVSRMVFSALDESTEYNFRTRAFTSKGGGPWSSPTTILTPGDVAPAPSNVQAMATSDQSVEVWWDGVPYFVHILGYQVLYSQTPVEDLDLWMSKRVPLTSSAEIIGLDSNTMYALRVAAYTRQGLGRLSELITVRVTPNDVPTQLRAHGVTTHGLILTWRPPTKLDPIKYKITYGAHKEFYDSQGRLQILTIPPQTEYVDPSITEYTIKQLMPFTSYQVNVTAIPQEETYRPPAKIIVTTAMAAPKPMVKPDSDGTDRDIINVILPQASEEYGPISHYFLVVVPDKFANKEPDHYTLEELTRTQEDEAGPYIAAKFLRRSMGSNFPLGDGKKYLGFLNRKVVRHTKYMIFVRAVVDTPQKSLYTSSPFSSSLSLESPSVSGKTSFPPGSRHKPDMINVSEINRNPQDAKVLWIVGVIIFVLLMVLCLIVLVLVKKRRQQAKTPAGDTTMKLLVNATDRELAIHPSDPVEMRRLNYQTPAMMSHPPIPVSELANHIERLKANDNLQFSQEYESIEPGQQFTWENSNLEANKPKNRYANVIAYDHSRVVLQQLDAIAGSDYINANYCDGYRKQNAYIATQGPLPETFGDFWRMVWEQRSATVLMMTKLEERTRIKCDQYWPTRGTETYGIMHVTLIDTQELATYCIRTFHIQRSGFNEKREVKQFQFTAWPDHGVPDHPTPFLVFLRRVRTMNPLDAGPMIVHCSAGVGRTGCFVVIDSMLERLKRESSVDIYGHVTCLRAQRNYMVQTEDQYIFIHDAVLEAVIAGDTEVPARNLYAHIQSLSQLVPSENCPAMEVEFKVLLFCSGVFAYKVPKLVAMKMQPNKFISANLPVNKFKNRLMNILPYESTRVCLQPIRGVDGSDYINASFIDGYRYRNAYIATQGPLPETTDDFWRMLWEHNCNIVVMLTKLKELGREKCHQYWPNERSQRYLYYVVDPITEYNMPQYILREFKVTDARDGQSRTIRQFHFVDWPEQGVPKVGEGFIEFIGQVHKTKEQFGQEGPITVHCSGGVGRTGVFITLSIVLERMQYEGVVDMFQTVRTLRMQRPGMVQNEDQYQFCYKAALEYLGSFDHYAN